MSVRYTLTAARQVEAALDYLAAQSPDAARGLRERLLAVTALLEAYPFMGHTTSVGHIRRFPLGTHPLPRRLFDRSGRDHRAPLPSHLPPAPVLTATRNLAPES